MRFEWDCLGVNSGRGIGRDRLNTGWRSTKLDLNHRAGFRPESVRENIKIKAGRRSDFEAFPTIIRPRSGPADRFPARKQYCVLYGNSSDSGTKHQCRFS